MAEQRYRCSIYVDIYVPEQLKEDGYSPDFEKMKDQALKRAEEAKKAIDGNHDIGNAYVGGAAWNPFGSCLDPKATAELEKI